MSFPQPNNQYKFVFNEYKKNAIIEKNILFTFSDTNTIYPYEIYKNFIPYECYDIDDCRYVLYIDSIHQKYCCVKTDMDPNNGKEYWFHNITKIYLKNKLVFNNSFEYNVPMYKI